jgi:hypothetical protein
MNKAGLIYFHRSSARTVEGLDGRVDDIQGQRRDEQDEDEERHEVVACHCGKVKAELLITLSELEIKEDNCSSCVRVGSSPPLYTQFISYFAYNIYLDSEQQAQMIIFTTLPIHFPNRLTPAKRRHS